MDPSSLPVLFLEGTYGDMGVAYGRRLAGMVDGNLRDYLRRFRAAGLSEADVRRHGERYREIATGYHPAIEAMLTGIAEGAGQPPGHIFALNARTELLYGAGRAADDGCTSLAVLPSRTAGGHVLLGQNWDWRPEQREFTFLLGTRDEDGFTVLTLAEAGMLAKTGLNSAGIGVCANLLVSDRDQGGDGVPYHFLLRGALQAATMADAIRATVEPARSGSGNILLADAGGEAIDLEVVPGDFGHLLPVDGLIAHANHFVSDVPVRDLRKASSALSLLRPERARHLLEERLAARQATIADLMAVFRDHYSFPSSICRHVDPRDAELDRVCSVYSIIMDLTERRFLIASYPPCEHDYEELLLDKLVS